nr:DHHW family protein [Tissierella sp.]
MNNLKEKKFNKNKIIAIIFLLFIFTFAIGTAKEAAEPIVTSISEKSSEKSNYPSSSKEFILFDALISEIETHYNEEILLKSEFINLNGAIHSLLNQKIVEDVNVTRSIIKMDNGQLMFPSINRKTDKSVINMMELNNFLKEKDIDMLYIQAPSKINKYNPELPKGLPDFDNENADSFLKGLKKHGVPYLDLRENIKEENLFYENLFFNTDHHWKTETAFWGYKNVMDKLGYDNSDREKTNINNFIVDEYKQNFLGSQGRRVGKFYGGIDDYTSIYPDFDTSYDIDILKHDGKINHASGSFRDTIIRKSNIDENLPITTNRYTSYFGGDYPLVKITNNDVEQGKTLILQDSFGLPFSSFMSLSFKQTDILDLRHFKEKTLFEYIDENDYDRVLFLYSRIGNDTFVFR